MRPQDPLQAALEEPSASIPGQCLTMETVQTAEIGQKT